MFKLYLSGYIPLPGSMRHSDCADWKIRGATVRSYFIVIGV